MKGRRVAAAVLAMLFLLAQRAWAVDISATAAVLMDADTGRILYEKNPDRPPRSLRHWWCWRAASCAVRSR